MKIIININKNKIIDPDASFSEILNANVYDPIKNNRTHVQDGGANNEFVELLFNEKKFKKKSYQLDFFPNSSKNLMNTKDKNVIMAFSIGNIINTAKIIKPQKGIFKTCFPEKKMEVNLDRNSTLTKANYSSVILYYDLFMIRKNQPKLNLVCKIPPNIIELIKKEYGSLIKTCFIDEPLNYKRENKRDYKRDNKKNNKKSYKMPKRQKRQKIQSKQKKVKK